MKLLSSAAVRRCLVADAGHSIISADYDQIELRIAAAFAGEQSLIDAARRGESLHKTTALRVFGNNYTPDQYRYTKNLNFGWLFGGGASTLSEQAGIPLGQARELIQEYERVMPALRQWKRQEQSRILRTALGPDGYRQYQSLRSRMFDYNASTSTGQEAIRQIKAQIRYLCRGKFGYVTLPSGRRILVEAEYAYKCINYKVQGTARDVLAAGLLDVMDDPELEPTVLLPVHDELLGQAPTRVAEYFAIRYGEVMTRDFRDCPITATGKVYGRSWGHGYGA